MISAYRRFPNCIQAASFARCFSQTTVSHTYIIPPPPKVVPPTSEVPDPTTFLQKIGRNMSEYADKFETWDDLIKADSSSLKEKGIDVRQRRYLLSWLQKFRQGEPLQEFKRGKKSWGGERKRKEVRAQYFGRLRAEQRANESK